MAVIKFGTDGWRAIIAKEYTTDNVARVAVATALWVKRNMKDQAVVIGHDCRFGGKMFAETTAKIIANNGIKVYLHDGIATTPMISLATKELGASLGVVITASHNPPEYNGYKLKAHFGGPMLPENITEVEKLIPAEHGLILDQLSIDQLVKKGQIEKIDLEALYMEKIKSNFDLESIRNADMGFAYNPMFGAGQDVMRKLMPEMTFMNAENNPGFNGVAPEPIHRNLEPFSDLIANANEQIACGLATDGDADRIGLYDEKGRFIDSHHIILLLIKYLVEIKKMSGKVVIAFSVSPKVVKLCKHYGLPVQVVPVGFKHVAKIMVTEDVLLGGEESGGIAIKGHIPERDGLWIGLTIWEYMVKSGKKLSELIDEVYEIVGPFAFERIDLHLTENKKQEVMANCVEGAYKQFGNYDVQDSESIDGYKYYFDNEQWVMIRPSGTEPVLRTYAESKDSESAFKILEATHKTFGA